MMSQIVLEVVKVQTQQRWAGAIYLQANGKPWKAQSCVLADHALIWMLSDIATTYYSSAT